MANDQSIQDYVIVPHQAILDRRFARDGTVKQFVAMPNALTGTMKNRLVDDAILQLEITPERKDTSHLTRPPFACPAPDLSLGGLEYVSMGYEERNTIAWNPEMTIYHVKECIQEKERVKVLDQCIWLERGTAPKGGPKEGPLDNSRGPISFWQCETVRLTFCF